MAEAAVSSEANFRVLIDPFEGPLDLLLYLIRKNDLELSRISIADITEQYLKFIHHWQQLNLDIASEYLVMAATLAWMKSRLLLPRIDEDEEHPEDLQLELIEKLLEYEKFKMAGEVLDSGLMLGRDVFACSADIPDSDREPESWAPVSSHDLYAALVQLLSEAKTEERQDVLNVTVATRSIEQGAQALQAKFATQARWTLRALFEDAETRVDIVVRFLALLELVRVGVLSVLADRAVDDIRVERRSEVNKQDYAQMVRGYDESE